MHLLSDQITVAELDVVLGFFQKAIDERVDGEAVELGCYVGTTSVHLQRLAHKHGKILHVYDSFEGLPPKTVADSSPAGIDFKAGELATSKKVLVANFHKHHLPLPIIHKGWFSNLTAADLPASVAFAFLDGDFYESIRDSFRVVWPTVTSGGFVLVHDYDRTTLPGAKRAVTDFLRTHHDARLVRVQQHIAVIQKAA